jgi:hypothetical protein
MILPINSDSFLNSVNQVVVYVIEGRFVFSLGYELKASCLRGLRELLRFVNGEKYKLS